MPVSLVKQSTLNGHWPRLPPDIQLAALPLTGEVTTALPLSTDVTLFSGTTSTFICPMRVVDRFDEISEENTSSVNCVPLLVIVTMREERRETSVVQLFGLADERLTSVKASKPFSLLPAALFQKASKLLWPVDFSSPLCQDQTVNCAQRQMLSELHFIESVDHSHRTNLCQRTKWRKLKSKGQCRRRSVTSAVILCKKKSTAVQVSIYRWVVRCSCPSNYKTFSFHWCSSSEWSKQLLVVWHGDEWAGARGTTIVFLHGAPVDTPKRCLLLDASDTSISTRFALVGNGPSQRFRSSANEDKSEDLLNLLMVVSMFALHIWQRRKFVVWMSAGADRGRRRRVRACAASTRHTSGCLFNQSARSAADSDVWDVSSVKPRRRNDADSWLVVRLRRATAPCFVFVARRTSIEQKDKQNWKRFCRWRYLSSTDLYPLLLINSLCLLLLLTLLKWCPTSIS